MGGCDFHLSDVLGSSGGIACPMGMEITRLGAQARPNVSRVPIKDLPRSIGVVGVRCSKPRCLLCLT